MKRFPGEFGNVWLEDDTAAVQCECGHEIDGLISGNQITRCPECGRGYKTEFVVWQFEPGEREAKEEKP